MEPGKVVMVTGAARGLGRAMAAGLVEAGMRVVAVHRPRPAGERAVDGALRIDADVTSEEDCRRVVAETIDRFGSLDVLVNNAAIAHDPFPKHHESELADVAVADWRRVLDVNVTGVLLMAQSAVPGMIERGWGRVITIGSVNADRMPFPGGHVYAMTKAAVAGLTRGLARDLGPRGITANVVQPGPVDTDMNPATGPFAETAKKMMAIPRYARADEIAAMVAYLAGPESGMVTGACLTIDGGFDA